MMRHPSLHGLLRTHGPPELPGSGTVDVKELKAALGAMGQHPSDEELFVMIHDVSCRAAGCYTQESMTAGQRPTLCCRAAGG